MKKSRKDRKAEKRRRQAMKAEKVLEPPAELALRVGLPRRLRNYFLAGILVTAPIAITFWLAWKMISVVDDWVTPMIPPIWNPENYLPFSVPGLGLIVVIFALIMIGFLTAGYAGRLITRTSDRIMERVPIVRSVYSWTKQVFETVLSNKSTAFREVVLIEYPCRGSWAVGFITGRTGGEVQDFTSDTVYNVFVPATPNVTTGFLLFIPEHDIHHLDISVEDGLKLVVSGGIVAPPDKAAAATESGWGDTTIVGEDMARMRDDQDALEPAKVHEPGAMVRLRNYLFTGILVTAPVAITAWLAWEFVTYVDGQVTPLIPPRWNPETYLPFTLPGLGVVVVVVSLTVIGFFTAGIVGRSLVRQGERILDQLPVIRSIYSAVKQIFETVFKTQSNAFREVVLIEYPRRESWAIGFITGNTEGQIQEEAQRDSYNIFLPTTPNPTSGFLLFIPKSETRHLSMTVEEGLKMVVSGGIVTPEGRAPDSAPEPEGDLPEGGLPEGGMEESEPPRRSEIA